jgi:hypothetical protein
MLTGMETKYMRKEPMSTTTTPPHLASEPTAAPHQGKLQLQMAQLNEELGGLRMQISSLYECLRDAGLIVQVEPDLASESQLQHGTVPGVCAHLLDLTWQVQLLRSAVTRIRQEQVF